MINAGFPYYNSASILSLLKAHVLGWQPDVITLYAAYNDASWPLEVGPTIRLLLWLQQRSITYLVLKEHVASDRRLLAVNRWIGRRLPGRVDESALERQLDQVAARYRRNVVDIVTLARGAGAEVVLAKQPMRTGQHRHRTYVEGYQAVRAKLRSGGRLSPAEFVFLAHHRLIGKLEAIGRERGLRVVDNISIVDANADHLATYVYLTEEGNLRLAEALRDASQPVRARATAPDAHPPQRRPSAAAADPTIGRP